MMGRWAEFICLKMGTSDRFFRMG